MRRVTQADFAREREPEVSRQRVGQWVDQGLIVLGSDGLLDADEAHARLDASLDESKGIRRAGNITSKAPGEGRAAVDAQDQPADREAYWDSRRRREAAEASISEAKALQLAGSLVSAAGVEKENGEIARDLRNAMLAIPDRLAQVLDPANPARAHKLLTDEISKALRECTSRLEQRAAESAGAERSAAALQ